MVQAKVKAGTSDAALAGLCEALSEAVGETLRSACSSLAGHRIQEPALLGLLGPEGADHRHTRQQWEGLRKKFIARDTLEKLVAEHAKEMANHVEMLHEATASLDFFRRVVSSLTESSEASTEARSCSVCLDEDLPLAKLAITPCAHTFCLSCLRAIVAEKGECSVCRFKLKSQDIRACISELKLPPCQATASAQWSSSSSSQPAAVLVDKESDRRHAKYGTKLAVMMAKLRTLRQEDPSAKVILFVQFDDLKSKVAEALTEFGISVAQLHGTVDQRAKTIRDWQNNASSSTFVLLLSLAQSASGTNLTAASHVIFLHPMLAASPEQAAAHELQAIGRARRYGQRRSVVHVWRFVTADTLEEEMTKRHQSALWMRDAASAPRHAVPSKPVAGPRKRRRT
eukprot:TRINITY_DN8043_c0_g1_i4.p1 TRINITY_DN8043_c0_g1~~TRINITY_DN8043_c0_g1_i4.p1  ORF type:complete len:399 (-),score=60.07 TRINITY_DN8043_c0_g1_i4:127-1323(-)